MASVDLPIALQLYTVRDVLSKDFEGGLKQLADLGYTHVELAGLYDRTPEQAKAALDAVGLRAVAAHEGITRIDEQPDAVVEQAKVLGYDVIVCPFLPDSMRTAEGYANTREMLTRFADDVAGDSLHVAYHNHAFEWDVLASGERGIDILFDGASGQAVGSELDTCWVAKGGDDPLAWMRKLAGRLPLIHVKDMDKAGTFTEVGTGVMPIQRIAQAAPGCGVKALVIEQDNSWVDGDPMKSAKTSLANLKAMLGRG